MATIRDVLLLVPDHPEAPDLLTAIDESQTSIPVLASIRGIMEFFRQKKDGEEAARKIVADVLANSETVEDDFDEEGNKQSGLILTLLKWLGKTILRRVLSPVLSTVVRITMAVGRFALRAAVQLIIRPVLTAVFGFIVANPLIAGAALLLGGLGYVIYNKWFKKEVSSSVMAPPGTKPSTLPSFETTEGERQRKGKKSEDFGVMETLPSGVPVVKSPTEVAKDLMFKKSKRQRFEMVKQDLVDAANKAGIDVSTIVKIAHFESGFDTTAAPVKLSSAHGLGQFLNAVWTQYINKYGEKYGINTKGGKLTRAEAAQYRNDPKIQAYMLAELTKENILLGRKLGGYNDDANVYALHNLGPGDGARFLKALKTNPNALVRSILSARVIKGNPSLYGNGSVTVDEAYRRMIEFMNAGAVYAKEAKALQDQGATRIASKPPTTEKEVVNPDPEIAQTKQNMNKQASVAANAAPVSNTQVASLNGKLVKVKV